MNTQDQAQKIVETLGGPEGFWKSSTEETVFNSVISLFDSGWDATSIFEFLEPLIYSIRSEYGD
jgi:hypothetical protein